MQQNSADSETDSVQGVASILCTRKKHKVFTAVLTEQCPSRVYIWLSFFGFINLSCTLMFFFCNQSNGEYDFCTEKHVSRRRLF